MTSDIPMFDIITTTFTTSQKHEMLGSLRGHSRGDESFYANMDTLRATNRLKKVNNTEERISSEVMLFI